MSLVKTTQQLAISAGTSLTKQFNEFNIRVRDTDGYIHATDMCKVGKGKKYNDYFRLSTTQEFLNELILLTGIPADRIIQGKGGRYGGTWVHPHIAINLAQWVSPIFAVKVAGWVSRFISGDLTIVKEVLETHDIENKTVTHFESMANPTTGEHLVIVESIPDNSDTIQRYDAECKFEAFKCKYARMINKHKSIIQKKDDKIDLLSLQISDQTRQIQELLNRTSYMVTTLDEVNTTATELRVKLDTVLPQRVDIKSNDPDYPQVFILRDLDAEEDDHNFYAMRCQTSNYNTRLKELKSKYGDNIKRACTIKQPNAVVFWKSVKSTFHANLICDSTSNWFSLKDMTKIQFKNKIAELNNKRINPV